MSALQIRDLPQGLYDELELPAEREHRNALYLGPAPHRPCHEERTQLHLCARCGTGEGQDHLRGARAI